MRARQSFDDRLAQIAQVGRSAAGGYARFAWTGVDLALREWFEEQARARGMDVVVDRAGNQWAWWGDPDADGPGVVTGSHLDSVPGGGAYDGPLGVISAFAAVEIMQANSDRPAVPVGVVNFSDEEGARFGVACVGSQVLTGALPAARALALRDGAGVTLAEALRGAGRPVDGPDGLGVDPEALRRVGAFVELHVEQGRALHDLEESSGRVVPVAVGAGIWPHGRWRVELRGEANHAGTTPIAHRHDPMLELAELILAVRGAAVRHGGYATVGKVAVDPGGVNAIPSTVTAWIDARAAHAGPVRAVLADLDRFSPRSESWTAATAFEPELAARLAAVVGAAAPAHPGWGPAPVIGTGAGHDAGILAAAGVQAGMLFVRNPTGVSHSPAEHAETADCEAGIDALAAVLTDLTRSASGSGTATR